MEPCSDKLVIGRFSKEGGKVLLVKGLLKLADRGFPAPVAQAHCDIPCGIYDPHLAQIAALTVIRMNQLIGDLKQPGAGASAQEVAAYNAALGRYVATKEHHAELCKSELRILWGDYFKPEHAQQYPDLHQRFWDAMKLASAARQKNDMDAAQKLLGAVQGIAEIFWKTKGAKPVRQPSRQTAGGELVYPS
ncbi:MAG: superoxide dismutase, Ni [Chloroflexi bacterium]|nr:superoxide dismutase, Ni [Chloroflexota bacterium]